MLLLAAASVAMSAGNAQERGGGNSLATHAHPKPAQHNDAPPGYTVEPPPSWVTPSPSTQEVTAESSAPMSYRVIDEQYQLGAKSETHYLHIVRVINQSAGIDTGSRIEILFDPSFQKLILHHLELVRAGKRLNRLNRKYPLLRRETQLERQIYDGRETLSIVLDDVRVGLAGLFEEDTGAASAPVQDGANSGSDQPRCAGKARRHEVRKCTPVRRHSRRTVDSSDAGSRRMPELS